jgi:hypothetical protein
VAVGAEGGPVIPGVWVDVGLAAAVVVAFGVAWGSRSRPVPPRPTVAARTVRIVPPPFDWNHEGGAA